MEDDIDFNESPSPEGEAELARINRALDEFADWLKRQPALTNREQMESAFVETARRHGVLDRKTALRYFSQAWGAEPEE